LISSAQGVTTAYSLVALEPRGILFVAPQTKVYEGMVIGEHSRENDLDVNPTKAKVHTTKIIVIVAAT
jgi:GTP-binding protein